MNNEFSGLSSNLFNASGIKRGNYKGWVPTRPAKGTPAYSAHWANNVPWQNRKPKTSGGKRRTMRSKSRRNSKTRRS